LNGRDLGNLAYLAPGAKPVDSYDPTKRRIAVFGINGSSGRNVNVTVNGIDNKDNTVGRSRDAVPTGSNSGVRHQHCAVLSGEWAQ
jgi:hypothetical protein